MSVKVTIKKYENRRLYNCDEKKYISLKDIETLITNGNKVEVVEQKTGKDITRQVLIQVLMEMDMEKTNVFPVEFLTFLIYSSKGDLKDYFETFFFRQMKLMTKNREMYLQALNAIENQWSSFKKSAEDNPFAGFFKALNPFIPEKKVKKDEPAVSETEDVNDLKNQVRDLLDRLTNLEDRLS